MKGKNFGGGRDRFGGKKSFGKKDFGRGGDRGSAMHKAICDKCHKECTLPFRPTAGKPVFCSDCFGGSSRSDSRGDFRRDDRRDSRRDFRRDDRRDSRREDREMFSSICTECGKECEVPFKPTAGKPVRCSECFDSKGGSSKASGVNSDQFNKKLEELNAKLDTIISLMVPFVSIDDEDEIKPAKKTETKKVEVKKEVAKKAEPKKIEAKKEVKKEVAKKEAPKKVEVKKAEVKKEVKKVEAKKVAPKKEVAKKVETKKTPAKKTK